MQYRIAIQHNSIDISKYRCISHITKNYYLRSAKVKLIFKIFHIQYVVNSELKIMVCHRSFFRPTSTYDQAMSNLVRQILLYTFPMGKPMIVYNNGMTNQLSTTILSTATDICAYVIYSGKVETLVVKCSTCVHLEGKPYFNTLMRKS